MFGRQEMSYRLTFPIPRTERKVFMFLSWIRDTQPVTYKDDEGEFYSGT